MESITVKKELSPASSISQNPNTAVGNVLSVSLNSLNPDGGNVFVLDGVAEFSKTVMSGANDAPFVAPYDTTVYPTLMSSINQVKIGSELSSLGQGALAYTTNLKSIEIPDTILSLGYAVMLSSGISSITIPGTISAISRSGFQYCPNLSTVVLSEGVEQIGQDAFRQCAALISIDIPTTISYYGSNAFNSTNSEKTVSLKNLKNFCESEFVSDSASPLFNGRKLILSGEETEDLVVAENISSVGLYTFDAFKGLKSLTLSSENVLVKDGAFQRCANLSSLKFEKPVKLNNFAFWNDTALTSIELPESLSLNGYSVFEGCSSVETISAMNQTLTDRCFGLTKNESEYNGSTGSYGKDRYYYSYTNKLSSVYLKDQNITRVPFMATEERSAGWYTDTYYFWLRYVPSEEHQNDTLLSACHVYYFSNLDKELLSAQKETAIDAGGTYLSDYAIPQLTDPEYINTLGNYFVHVPTAMYENWISANSWKLIAEHLEPYAPVDGYKIGRTEWDWHAEWTEYPSYHYSRNGKKEQNIIGDFDKEMLSSYFMWNGYKTNVNWMKTTSITLGDAVNAILPSGLSGMSQLTSITIPSSVVDIGISAFAGCSKLSDVYFPENTKSEVSSMDDYSWELIKGCTIHCMDGDLVVEKVDPVAMSRFYFTDGSVVEENIVGEMDDRYGENNSLSAVELGRNVTSIGWRAFYSCSGLKSVTIPDGVTNIRNEAFYKCSELTAITIPANVTSIGENTFDYCYKLAAIVIDPNNTIYDSRNNCNAIIRTADNTLIQGCKNTIIPDSVTDIWYSAFCGCSGLTSITIPDGVKSIRDSAFRDCSGLTSVTIPDSVTIIGLFVFYGCSGLTSVTIGNSVMSVEDYAFYGCSGLKSVVIPDSVTIIDYSAFEGCSGLTSITIPDGVTSIGDSAFSSCSNLSSITCQAATAPTVQFSTFGLNTSSYTGYPTRGNNVLKVPQGATGYDTGAWADPLQDADKCGFHIEYLPQPSSKTKAYYSDGSIQEYDIEGTLNQGDVLSTDLVAVEIGSDVTSIGRYAFYRCSRLTSIKIPDSVTSIGYCAFASCYGLTSITIPNGVKSIEDGAFQGCSGLTSVTIPDSVTSIRYGAFWQCSSLTSITIPNGVTSIGDYAFCGCTALSSITSLRTSAPTVKSGMFGTSESDYTGRNTYSTGNNVLKVPANDTGYDASYWADPLCNSEKCGFHIEYI